MNELDRRWFAAYLLIAVYEINRASRKQRMSVEVKGLADTVRQVKEAISAASLKSADLQASANALTSNLAQVDSLKSQLDAANAELQAVVGQLSNGGPPLEPGTPSEPVSHEATF